MQDLFVDRLGNVTVAGGVARLDFLRLESIDAEKKQVMLKPSTRLVIPLDGLMLAIQMLEQMRGELLKQAPSGRVLPTAKDVVPGVSEPQS